MILHAMCAPGGVICFDGHTGWVTHSKIDQGRFQNDVEELESIVRFDIKEYEKRTGFQIDKEGGHFYSIHDFSYWMRKPDGTIYYDRA